MNGVPGENFAVGTRQKHNNQSRAYIFSQALDSRQLERHATEMSDCRGHHFPVATTTRSLIERRTLPSRRHRELDNEVPAGLVPIALVARQVGQVAEIREL